MKLNRQTKFKSINDAWTTISKEILNTGKTVNGTHELSNVSFTIEDINDNVLSCRHALSVHYYLGEMIWYASGANDVRFISKFGKIWTYLTDDNLTNNSAYGYILQYKHGFNQVDKMIELLKADPNSRRAVMNINVPNRNVIETKDEMCTIALQFLLRDGKLYGTGIMRSNDIWTGTPYDIFYFTELQKYIANELGVEYGSYTHFVTSMHIYNRDIKKIEKSIDNYVTLNYLKVNINGQKILKNGLKYYKELQDVPKEEMKQTIIDFGNKEKLCSLELEI